MLMARRWHAARLSLRCTDMPVQDQPDPATTLCTSCGLCCDDHLHTHIVLKESEIKSAVELGLPVLTDGRCGSALPCPKLIDRRCSIYRQRPNACQGYKCQLLYDLEADRVSLPDALETVVAAHKLGAAFMADRAAPPTPDTVETAQRTLRLTIFRLFLDRHFRNKYEGPMVSQELVGGRREGPEP